MFGLSLFNLPLTQGEIFVSGGLCYGFFDELFVQICTQKKLTTFVILSHLLAKNLPVNNRSGWHSKNVLGS